MCIATAVFCFYLCCLPFHRPIMFVCLLKSIETWMIISMLSELDHHDQMAEACRSSWRRCKAMINIPALEANVSWHAAVDRNMLPLRTHPDSFNPLLEFFSKYSRHTAITSVLFVAPCPWNHVRRITCEPGFSLQSHGARVLNSHSHCYTEHSLLLIGNVFLQVLCVRTAQNLTQHLLWSQVKNLHSVE